MAERLSVIDLHSHILPAVDHGCKDIYECAHQLKLMRELGTDIAVATPHFYPNIHSPEDFRETVDKAICAIRSMDTAKAPTVYAGAEVLICDNLQAMVGLELLCVQGTRTLLLELPMANQSESQLDTVEALMGMGYTVVLAHIDRYVRDNDHSIRTLVEMGALAQINAEALSHGSMRKRLAYYINETDSVAAIGSDLHGADKHLYRKFADVRKQLGTTYDDIMARSASLLSGAQRII